MVTINSDDVKGFFEKSGNVVASLALNIYGESLNQAGQKAFSEAIEIGIANTVAALFDTNVDDEEIIRALNEYWGINRDEAEGRLVFEKHQATIRSLKRYLKLQGFSAKEVSDFMTSNNALMKIKHNKELWKLRRKPEKLMNEVRNEV